MDLTVKEYLMDNDKQSLLGSLIQYGFTFEDLDRSAKNGEIEIKDSMVYLVDPDFLHLPDGQIIPRESWTHFE